MTDEDIVKYISKETKFKPNEIGGISMTFKAYDVYLTIYRAGKKSKDVVSSKILNGIDRDDAIEICDAIQRRCELNVENKKKVISMSDRIKAMKLKQSVDSKKEGEW